MNRAEMINIVQSQLATDLNCTVDDLTGKNGEIVFVEARENEGRRPFPRKEDHFNMLTMGKSVVVSTSPKILEIVKPLLEGKRRDDAFEMDFVQGQRLEYLPDLANIKPLAPIDGFSYEIIEQCGMPELYKTEGFNNAILYDQNHPRPDMLAVLAKKDGQVVGMAGASADCAKMWQIGIDVLPAFRHFGLAAYLVNWLTLEILRRGFVPYYATMTSNVASQRVAHRVGYAVGWAYVNNCRV